MNLSMQQIAVLIAAIIHSASTLVEARFKPTSFTRNRKMPFETVLRFMLENAKLSTQTALNRFMRKIGRESIEVEKTISQQAFSEARNKFDHSPFEKMFRAMVKEDYSKDELIGRYSGYKVFAIDGSTYALPNLKTLKEEFGVSGSGKDSATARSSLLYDMVNDRIIDAAIAPYSVGERDLAMGHISRIPEVCEKTDDVLLIFDRGYASIDLMRFIESQPHKMSFLMRVRRKWNVDVDNAPLGSSFVEIEGIRLRVIKFILPSDEIETLVTNLYDMDDDLFPDLYYMRWPIEVKYDIIKNKLCIEYFSGYTANAIRQDFWIAMTLANIAAIAKTEADAKIKSDRKDKPNKWEYQANVNNLIASVKDRFAEAVFSKSIRYRLTTVNSIINEVARCADPIRPFRNSPRDKSIRNSKYHYNSKPNS